MAATSIKLMHSRGISVISRNLSRGTGSSLPVAQEFTVVAEVTQDTSSVLNRYHTGLCSLVPDVNVETRFYAPVFP